MNNKKSNFWRFDLKLIQQITFKTQSKPMRL